MKKMSEISRNNPQRGGGNEGQERISSAAAAEDDAPSRPLIAGEENEQSPVSLDLQPLPYNDLSDPEKEAYDRFVSTVPHLFRDNELEPSVQQQGEQSSLPFLKNLVTEHPKITRVKKTHTDEDEPSFLLLAVTLALGAQAGTAADISLTDLFKVLIENNPSACFWAPGPSYPICIKSIGMRAPLILLWLANTLPSVLRRTYQIHQENGSTDVGFAASFLILEHYFQQRGVVSAAQVQEYFDKYPQGLGEYYRRDNQQISIIIYIVGRISVLEFRDEHLNVLKFVASKRPDLLCTPDGEFPLLFNAMVLVNKFVERGELLKDRACSLIKILVRECPASVVTEGNIINISNPPAKTPFDVIQHPNFPPLAHIRDDLKSFFDLTKECLDRQAALEADLSLVQTVLDKVKGIAKIHHHSFPADGRTGEVFGGKKSAYQEWAFEFIQKSGQAHKDVFAPLSATAEASENLLSGNKRRRVEAAGEGMSI